MYCPKLARAQSMLLELLADGAVAIVDCLAAARELGIGERTTYKARSLSPIECLRDDPSKWVLVAGRIKPPQWRKPRVRKCWECSKPMVGAHWLRRRHAGRCKRAFQARNARGTPQGAACGDKRKIRPIL